MNIGPEDNAVAVVLSLGGNQLAATLGPVISIKDCAIAPILISYIL
jgi:hypothetical protein